MSRKFLLKAPTVNGVGNHSVIVRIIDNGDPGLNDRFGLRVTSPSGAILVDLTVDPIQLSGGNLSVAETDREITNVPC